MATTTKTVHADYTNISNIKSYWLDNIATKYFDFNNVNNYNAGIFGYINEIMANTTEDAFNAISTARREFYPVTAQFTSSLYAMATLQSINIPLTKPAVCKCALIIPQNEIIENSTFDANGIGKCVIDNCLKIFAGDLQFMLDYPIEILSKKTSQWSHTIRYNISVENSLNVSGNERYISNKILKENGINYVILFIDYIRQLEMTEISNVVVKDSILDTITMDIDFDGNLANFEVFYKENANSEEKYLTKVMINGVTPNKEHVLYELVNPNKIRLTFRYNPSFHIKYNSEIICRIYTSQGSEGNFNSFEEDLVCSSDSEKYPYNANMTILGKVNGSASGGSDQMLTEDFRNAILKAYSTNNTITSSHDLQVHFDDIADDISNVKVLFKKKRDDPFIRLFGAYSIMKDENKNIIPTNTLTIEFQKNDFGNDNLSQTRISITPGTLFTYKRIDTGEKDAENNPIYKEDNDIIIPVKKSDDEFASILDLENLMEPDRLYFTNPFLMVINLDPNNVGYYMASNNTYIPIEYTDVNDKSIQQFIGGTLSVYRNSIGGSNYYKFRILLTPSTDMDPESIITFNDPTSEDNIIRAEYNGRVVKEEYYFDEEKRVGYVRYAIEYITGIDDNGKNTITTKYIQASNTVSINRDSSITGYEMLLNVGDKFIAHDIIATKRVGDLGKLLICGNLNSGFNDHYIPFSVQGFNESVQGYIMEAYLATNDIVDTGEKITIVHGIYDKSGNDIFYNTDSKTISIDMRDQILEMNTLYSNNDKNIENKYTSFTGLNNFTLTNTYKSNENEKINLIGSLPFIRSVVNYAPNSSDPSDKNFTISIKESPVIGANWAIDKNKNDYFVAKYISVNDQLNSAYYRLENNFSIDNKFYNTYGKAKFFTVGNGRTDGNKMIGLDNVRCKFHFGVKLNTITSTDQFIDKFRQFIKEYIESDAKITTAGQDLYIMNMISEIKSNFSEIGYIEYYGFNSYGHEAQKVIGPELTDYQENYIPEFLNLDTLIDLNGKEYPNIIVDILS